MKTFKKHDFGDVTAWELGCNPFTRPIMNVFVYLTGGILVDTGQSHMRRELLAALEGREIGAVVLTHHHEDHSGNASVIRDARGIPVYAHPLALPPLRDGYPFMPFQYVMWGRPGRVIAAPLPETVRGEKISLTPVHTPGHSADHVAFLEKNRGWLFSGDLYLGRSIRYFRFNEDIQETVASLEKALALDFDVLFCAHNPQKKEGKKTLREKLEFLRNFCGEIEGYASSGYDAKGTVRLLAHREDRFIKYFTFGNASFAHMVRSVYRGLGRERRDDNDAQECPSPGSGHQDKL